MRKQFRIGSLDGFIRISRIQNIEGMCSNLQDGRHILMFDFDNVEFGAMRGELQKLQVRHNLPDIIVLETKEEENYVAYCFAAMEWRDALAIVLDMPLICWNFWRLSVSRGYFTLRYSSKSGRVPTFRATLPGTREADVGIADLCHAIKYETGRGR